MPVQGIEGDHRVEPVAELRREEVADRLLVPPLGIAGETDGPNAHLPRPGIGGHDQDDIAEIGMPAGIVGQGGMIHDLQQDVEDIRVGLLDLIGFTGDAKGRDQKAIRNMFSPEFRNRLDAVITFNALDRKVMGMIVDKMIEELQEQIVDKKVRIELDRGGPGVVVGAGLRSRLRGPAVAALDHAGDRRCPGR